MRLPYTLLALLLVFCVYPKPNLAAQSFDFDFDLLGLQTEDFFLPTHLGAARLSPDGEHLAYSHIAGNNRVVRVRPLPQADDEGRVFWGENPKTETISQITWKDSRRLLYQTSNGNIYIGDLDTNKSILLFGAQRTIFFRNAIFWDNFTQPRILSALANDPKHILISAFDDSAERLVYKLPIEDWNKRKKDLKPVVRPFRSFDYWSADSDGNVRLAMKVGRNSTELFYSESNGRNWKKLDRLLSDDPTRTFNIDTSNIASPRDYLIGLGFNQNQFYFASNRQTDTAAIYLYDISKKRVESTVFHDPEYDVIDTTQGTARFLFSDVRKKLVGILYHRDKPTIEWLDESFKAKQQLVDSLLPGSSNLLFDWDNSEEKILVQAISSNALPTTYLYDAGTNRIKPIAEASDPIAKAGLQKTRPITIPNGEHGVLSGYFTPGKTENDATAPMILLVHGGPWARDSYGFDPIVQCLSYNGFSVLQINYRGSTGYGYKHFYAGNRDYGMAVIDDLKTSVEWSIDTELAERENVAIMGFSFGGYAAALAPALLPDMFQCAVPMAGIYDLKFESKKLKKKGKGTLAYAHWEEMVGEEWNDPQKLNQISPINVADRIHIPMLIAHGKQDPVSDIEHADRFVEKLKTFKAEHEYIILEEEGHSIELPKNQAFLFDRVIYFLNTHLKSS